MLKNVIFVFMLAFSVSCSALEGEYLSDALENDNYRNSFNALLDNNDANGTWNISSQIVFLPAHSIKIQDENMVVFEVCKLHDCIEQHLFVLFSANGKQAWAYEISSNKSGFYGNPGSSIQSALMELIEGNTNISF